MTIMPELSQIRNPIDEQRLDAYLSSVPRSAIVGQEVPTFTGPFQTQQFTFGQSNPTYLVCDSTGKNYVLRRKPTSNGKLVSRSAHAIEREFFILNGIARCNQKSPKQKQVPVPEVYFLCEDESVLGAVFYMMEYIDGKPIKLPEMKGIPEEKQDLYWESIMTTISAIHSIDCNELIKHLPAKHFPQFQPEKLARSSTSMAYFKRQIKTLSAVEASQSEVVPSVPGFQQLTLWVDSHAPKDPETLTLIHGDCKIDNFLFDKNEEKVVAVLDWELCTMGHPMFDLANFLQPYILPKSINQMIIPGSQIGNDVSSSTDHVQKVLRLYESILGHPWRDNNPKNNPQDLWRLGSVFGLLRLCVITQGVALRVEKGVASSASAASVGKLYFVLSKLALEITNKDSKL